MKLTQTSLSWGVTPFLGMKMQLNKENPGKYKGNSIVIELDHKCLARQRLVIILLAVRGAIEITTTSVAKPQTMALP